MWITKSTHTWQVAEAYCTMFDIKAKEAQTSGEITQAKATHEHALPVLLRVLCWTQRNSRN